MFVYRNLGWFRQGMLRVSSTVLKAQACHQMLGVSPSTVPAMQVMLRVGDLEKSMAWYKDVLGMNIIRVRENPENKYTLAFAGYSAAEEDCTVSCALSSALIHKARDKQQITSAPCCSGDLHAWAFFSPLSLRKHSWKLACEQNNITQV